MIYNVFIKQAHAIYQFAYLGLKHGVQFFTMHTLKTLKIKSAYTHSSIFYNQCYQWLATISSYAGCNYEELMSLKFISLSKFYICMRTNFFFCLQCTINKIRTRNSVICLNLTNMYVNLMTQCTQTIRAMSQLCTMSVWGESHTLTLLTIKGGHVPWHKGAWSAM